MGFPKVATAKMAEQFANGHNTEVLESGGHDGLE